MVEMARQVMSRLPDTASVVVLNFTPVASQHESRLGAYLAERFGAALKARGGTRLRLIERQAGSKAFYEEMKYMVNRPDPVKVLEHFQAQWAIVATYDLDEESRSLEVVSLRAVPRAGADVAVACGCRAVGEYARWQKDEKALLPTECSSQLLDFLNARGAWDAIGSVSMVEAGSGGVVPANGEIAVGDGVELRVEVKQPCFLYILGWDGDNKIMTALSPQKGQSAKTGAGTFTLGPFEARAPGGYNWVKAIAARQELGSEFVASEKYIVDKQMQDRMVEKIEALGDDNWGSEFFPFRIVE